VMLFVSRRVPVSTWYK